MSLLLHTIVTHIKENVIRKLQNLYNLPRNTRAGNKSPVLFVKNLFARAIYRPHTKYSLKGLPLAISFLYFSNYPTIPHPLSIRDLRVLGVAPKTDFWWFFCSPLGINPRKFVKNLPIFKINSLFYAKFCSVLQEIFFMLQKSSLWGLGPKN